MKLGRCHPVFNVLPFLVASLARIIAIVANNTFNVAPCRSIAHRGSNAHPNMNISYAYPYAKRQAGYFCKEGLHQCCLVASVHLELLVPAATLHEFLLQGQSAQMTHFAPPELCAQFSKLS